MLRSVCLKVRFLSFALFTCINSGWVVENVYVKRLEYEIIDIALNLILGNVKLKFLLLIFLQRFYI